MPLFWGSYHCPQYFWDCLLRNKSYSQRYNGNPRPHYAERHERFWKSWEGSLSAECNKVKLWRCWPRWGEFLWYLASYLKIKCQGILQKFLVCGLSFGWSRRQPRYLQDESIQEIWCLKKSKIITKGANKNRRNNRGKIAVK